MNTTTTMNTMTNRQLYGVVAIALVVALVLGALGWTSRPNISISITVTPAPVFNSGQGGGGSAAPSFADLAKQYGVNDVAQALAPAQVAQLAQAPVPTAAAVIRPQLPDPPVVQGPAPDTGNYNVAVDENATFGRIVLLENVWFQCRKVVDVDHFDTQYHTANVWYTDNVDNAKWAGLSVGARQRIVNVCHGG